MFITHWELKAVIIGSGNGLAPVWCQAFTWTNADLLLIAPLGTNFNEISIKIQQFSFKEMHFRLTSAKCRPFCFSLNMVTGYSNTLQDGRLITPTDNLTNVPWYII